MKFLKKLFKEDHVKTLNSFKPLIPQINDLEDKISNLSDDQLRKKTTEFRDRIKSGESLDDILPESFAVVREASKRTLNQRPYDVQLLGGIVLHKGKIAEMRTGEGKTLVATLPAYLNALEGKGVHIITVNDYLSRRDAVLMGQIYAFLGMSVGIINHESSFLYDPGHKQLDEERDELGGFRVVHEFLRDCSRREAYEADITYGTNNEFGFDYLRDNIVYSEDRLVQTNHNFTIVDEIDSILIDEARTPLIISSPAQDSGSLYKTFATIATKLKKNDDYKVDEKLKAITLTDNGITKAENILGVGNIYTEKGIKYVHHLETAIRAQALFENNKDYVVRDGEIIIVDEFTGRMQPGRRWSEGLHQAIEAKEGVPIQKESRTAATVTFQNYFRFYEKISGMTGTALTSSEEFHKVYGLEVIPVDTNMPMIRVDNNDLIFQTEQGKFKAVARKIKELNEKGQPVLVGTVSVEKNELLSAYLNKEGIKHKLLNAKNHENEGEVIAQAGKKNGVFIATNMAGRGVDIKLGGNPATEEQYEEVKKLGGLFVLGTERHEARRIDDQLRGRTGRQGDPGETQFFVSLEDTLMRVFASDTIKKMMGRFGIPEDQPIENSMISKSLESAQEKIEGFNFDSRKHVLEYDNVMSYQRNSVYKKRRKILLGSQDDLKEFLDSIKGDDNEVDKMVEEKIKIVGEEDFWKAFRILCLQVIDMLWMEHLEVMDFTRSSVGLRAYGQKDPLVEYKKEGLKMFKEMEEIVNHQILGAISNIGAGMFKQEEQKLQEIHNEASLIGGQKNNNSQGQVRNENKVGRNDPCPCGSGKKYKKCCGK